MADRVNRNKKRKKEMGVYFDYSLLFITIFMVCFGLVILYSASSFEASIEFSDSTYYLKRQFMFAVMGVVGMIIISRMDYHFLRKDLIALVVYFGSLVIVGCVVTPLGIEANGARRWINLGFTSLQVCEVIKIAIIIFMAYVIDKTAKKLKRLDMFVECMLIIGLAAGVIAIVTSDLSSAVIIAGIGMVMLLIACPRFIYFVVLFVTAGAAGVGLIALEPYRFERVRVWLDPAKYADEGGYQVLQSLYSVGSGGLFGKGLGNGIQKLGYVPEAQNDMIFTVVCEELGIVGGIAVILMFIFMIWRFMIVSNNAPDLFGSMIVVGVMAHISIQTLMNIAVVTNSMPNTGVTLPFMSYGGTSILLTLFEVGLVLSVSRRIRFE